MNWAWATSLDQFWRSPGFPMWLTLAAAGFFAIIIIIALAKAEKSVANGALAIITLLAIGIAAVGTTRGVAQAGRGGAGETSSTPPASAALPALSCIDELAGDTVLAACEKALFGSPDAVAAALSYAASQINFVTSLGDAAAASGSMTTGQLAVRRAVERDRYGLVAYVLAVRDHCTVSECSAFRALTDRHQIVSNMDERVYEGMIARYAPSWNAPAAAAPVAALSPPLVGKPTNADFPSAASTPPVNIMSPEPATTPAAAPRPPASLASAPLPSSRPASTAAVAPAAAKKQAAPKPVRAPPTQLAPVPAPATAPATAPAASND